MVQAGRGRLPGWLGFLQAAVWPVCRAENKGNLPRNYYENLQAGKSQIWVDVYVHGRYGSVMDGKPVYPEYNDAIHCAKRAIAADPWPAAGVGL